MQLKKKIHHTRRGIGDSFEDRPSVTRLGNPAGFGAVF